MQSSGTVRNGVIVPDGPPPPDGTRVHFQVEERFEYPHPMAPYDREKEIALLRESIAKAEEGLSQPIRDVLRCIAIEKGYQLTEDELASHGPKGQLP
jgi:hypothetical protein